MLQKFLVIQRKNVDKLLKITELERLEETSGGHLVQHRPPLLKQGHPQPGAQDLFRRFLNISKEEG